MFLFYVCLSLGWTGWLSIAGSWRNFFKVRFVVIYVFRILFLFLWVGNGVFYMVKGWLKWLV